MKRRKYKTLENGRKYFWKCSTFLPNGSVLGRWNTSFPQMNPIKSATFTLRRGFCSPLSRKAGTALYCTPSYSLRLKLMAPSTQGDTDVLLGQVTAAQQNQGSPIHKSKSTRVRQWVCNPARIQWPQNGIRQLYWSVCGRHSYLWGLQLNVCPPAERSAVGWMPTGGAINSLLVTAGLRA